MKPAEYTVSVEEMCTVLNRMLKADPEAMRKLVLDRVPCNRALADDPTAQVAEDEDGTFTIGLIGVLNGILGIKEGWGPIAAIIDAEDNSIQSFMPTPIFFERSVGIT